MSKNANTIATGGNRFDCGPSIHKKVDKLDTQAAASQCIASKRNKETYINGFEAALNKINFR